MSVGRQDFGGLRSQWVDALPAGRSPKLAVVFCHGFGAPGTDLVPLGSELLSHDADLAESVRFVFPAAPLSLESRGLYGGRAWWHLDLEARLMAIERGEIRDLRNDYPEGLDDARTMLVNLVEEIREAWNLDASQIVLGGFSQGAMIATETALTLPESPAALCLLSGTILCEDRWRDLASRRGPLRVLQSHGRQDPILPFVAAEWLRDLLGGAGLNVEFFPFDGGHTIPFEALQRTTALLREVAGSLPN
jgi:phospholipase/carboxylesterase